jgi:glucose-1-phosphatase
VTNICNIILDLGGVIINLDQPLTVSRFNALTGWDFETIYNKTTQSEIFNAFDKGQVTEDQFFDHIAKELRYKGEPLELIKAWNAMLLDVPAHRLDTLVDLRGDYRTFLLSNTCETHIREFERSLHVQHGIKNFNDYFDQVYYSCRVGMRKPDKEIFELVLEENELDPVETVFIDDSVQHVKGAGDCGIRAYLLQPGMELRQLLKQLKLL